MKKCFVLLLLAVLTACADYTFENRRAKSTYIENSLGGTYDNYWTPEKWVVRYAAQNCARYNKQAIMVMKGTRQTTFECR